MPSAVKKEEMQNLPIVSADDPIGQIKQAANNKVRNLEKRKVIFFENCELGYLYIKFLYLKKCIFLTIRINWKR